MHMRANDDMGSAQATRAMHRNVQLRGRWGINGRAGRALHEDVMDARVHLAREKRRVELDVKPGQRNVHVRERVRGWVGVFTYEREQDARAESNRGGRAYA